jgi:hypothetical protein
MIPQVVIDSWESEDRVTDVTIDAFTLLDSFLYTRSCLRMKIYRDGIAEIKRESERIQKRQAENNNVLRDQITAKNARIAELEKRCSDLDLVQIAQATEKQADEYQG